MKYNIEDWKFSTYDNCHYKRIYCDDPSIFLFQITNYIHNVKIIFYDEDDPFYNICQELYYKSYKRSFVTIYDAKNFVDSILKRAQKLIVYS